MKILSCLGMIHVRSDLITAISKDCNDDSSPCIKIHLANGQNVTVECDNDTDQDNIFNGLVNSWRISLDLEPNEVMDTDSFDVPFV